MKGKGSLVVEYFDGARLECLEILEGFKVALALLAEALEQACKGEVANPSIVAQGVVPSAVLVRVQDDAGGRVWNVINVKVGMHGVRCLW